MTEHQNHELEAVLQSMKTEPPDEAAFREALQDRLLAESSLGATVRLPWYKRHPILVGTLSGALTAAVILVVAPNFIQPPSVATPATSSLARTTSQAELPTAAAPKVNPADAPKSDVEPTHRVPSQRVALIKFHFSSEVAVTDVDMKIELPQGLKFWSQGKELVQNQVAWMSNLKQGVNTIPVAVFAAAPGRYDVIATAMVDGKPIRHTVVLEVSDEA